MSRQLKKVLVRTLSVRGFSRKLSNRKKELMEKEKIKLSRSEKLTTWYDSFVIDVEDGSNHETFYGFAKKEVRKEAKEFLTELLPWLLFFKKDESEITQSREKMVKYRRSLNFVENIFEHPATALADLFNPSPRLLAFYSVSTQTNNLSTASSRM